MCSTPLSIYLSIYKLLLLLYLQGQAMLHKTCTKPAQPAHFILGLVRKSLSLNNLPKCAGGFISPLTGQFCCPILNKRLLTSNKGDYCGGTGTQDAAYRLEAPTERA